jgi:hydrogenase maturation protease
MTPAPPVTVIAIGNPYRQDDGAASAVLTQLAERLGGDERVRLVDLDGESVRLVQAWEGSSLVWIVDAIRSGRPPGSLHEVDATRLGELDDHGVRIGGGHLMGLREAVDLARVLDLLPADLRVLGIEGESFDNGEGLSPAVATAVVAAAETLAASIGVALATRAPAPAATGE